MSKHMRNRSYSRLEFHPYNIFMVLLISGLSVMFLGLTAAYLYSRITGNMEPIRIPSIFLLNTAILMGTSWMLRKARGNYQEDKTRQYQRALLLTILLTILFLCLQVVGWNLLLDQNTWITSSTLAAYVYIVSALHFVHIIAGLPFLILFLITSYRKMKEPVSVLVYFSDPAKKLRLRLLSMYWHWLDFLWIYIISFFWLNWLFR
jgi:cytochrome c oxidase subunit 3